MKTDFIEIESRDSKYWAILELEYIGRGQSAIAYKNNADLVVLFVDLEDQSRKLITQVKSQFIPNMVYLGIFKIYNKFGNCEHKQVYLSELYYAAENTLSYELNTIWNDFRNHLGCNNLRLKGHKYVNSMLDYFMPRIENELMQVIIQVWEILKDQKHIYILEFPDNNLMQDKKGNLILLDIAFVYSTE